MDISMDIHIHGKPGKLAERKQEISQKMTLYFAAHCQNVTTCSSVVNSLYEDRKILVRGFYKTAVFMNL